MTHSVTELAFNKLIGLQQVEAPGMLALPAGPQYLNHLGTVHASALLTLAEAASGEFLLRHFGRTEGVIAVVRRLEAKFRKPANGAVTARISTPASQLDQVKGELETKGRSLIGIAVELHDQTGNHVLSATIDWFITTAP